MRRIRATVLLGLVTALVALLVFRTNLLAPLFDAGRASGAPVERTLGRTGSTIGGTLTAFVRVGTLTARVRELEAALAQATAEAARLESLQEENAHLRTALDLRARVPLPLVMAEVTGPSTDGVSVAVRINRGADDGIQPRAPVLSADGIVVGRVRAVVANTATVDLLTGGQFRVTVRDLATRAQGVVRGVRGLDVVVEGVPRTEALRVGDRLVTTGIDGVFPPHLLVGTVRTVRAPEHAIFQEGSVQLPLDPRRLSLVAVITEPPP